MNSGNVFRIEVDFSEKSSEAKVLEEKIRKMGVNVKLEASNVYTINYPFSEKQIREISDSLHNEIVQSIRINEKTNKSFDWALEIGFLPGVTDNVANTTTEIINDLLGISVDRNKVFYSKLFFITADISKQDVEKIANNLANTLIERFHIKSYNQYVDDNGMDYVLPVVKLNQEVRVDDVDLNVSEEELIAIGKKGILDPETGKRRGPLALGLDYLHAIQKYSEKENRNPTDIELESIAQTWSEHCKHTLFAGRIDEVKNGIFSECIKKATEEIRQSLNDDFCVSVFKDNSGGILFDENFLITDKVETHNTPSILDPFGGAITGIVGVNRDTIGFGIGAKPIANRYGFCMGLPEDKRIVYRSGNKQKPSLSPRRIFDGVVHGVNVGGNCSGIPTPQGFVYFDDSYRGKPLVFVGTIGLMPRKLMDRYAHEKSAKPGDRVVMIGGRVGKDGIHGATFSSEALDEGSPATAVQIGDPITQKKFSDAIINEARELNLYNSITDNGAGGLSCSVAEMARESGGFEVDIEKVPLKYPGLQPWETWISESQERMTLAVPGSKLEEFLQLMDRRGIEATAIGKFTDSGRAVVRFNGKTILDLDMDFLHNGLPKREFDTKPYGYKAKEPRIEIKNHLEIFEKILGSHNVCSFEFISRQYDHEVQNSSVVKPLQGKGRVNGTASVIRPLFNSKKGIVLSQGLYPRMSEINTYDMAACAIDTAIRNSVAAGGNINHLALLDNFCWCSSDEPDRLAQLKEAGKACYDYATIYKTPFISGKDSMFNDFKGFDENGNPLKISVLPTLLVSSIGVVEDVEKTNTIDFKVPGDLIYLLGQTKDECGGSEFYRVLGELGEKTPKVDAEEARKLYEKVHSLHQEGILSACSSIGYGGLLIAVAKMSIAGQYGANIDVSKIPNDNLSIEKILYSESQSRFIVTVAPENKENFEKEMKGFVFGLIGSIDKSKEFVVKDGDNEIIRTNVDKMEKIYKEKFGNY